jgi:proline iminopeptidase
MRNSEREGGPFQAFSCSPPSPTPVSRFALPDSRFAFARVSLTGEGDGEDFWGLVTYVEGYCSGGAGRTFSQVHSMSKLYSFFLLLLLSASMVAAPSDSVAVHSVQRGDVSLVYETEGKGDVVILLAGGPGVTPYSVKYVFDKVSKDHEAVLLHQRGTGKTKLPKADSAHLSLPIFLDDIDSVRNELHADKITLIGHSWGGMLAMAYAGAHPDRVSHLILMDSGGVDISFGGVFQDNINMHLQAEDLALRKKSAEENMLHDPLGNFHYLESILPGYFYKRENAMKFMREMKPEDYNASLRPLLMGFDIKDSIVKYHGPVDIIQGRQDPIDASTIQLNMKYLPQAKVHWVERAGHIPWLENQSGFDACLNSAFAAG